MNIRISISDSIVLSVLAQWRAPSGRALVDLMYWVAAALVGGDMSNATRNGRHAEHAELLGLLVRAFPIKSFGCVKMIRVMLMAGYVVLVDIFIQV